MDFLIDGVKYAVVAWVFWTTWKLIQHRYAMATELDSNAPAGRRTDWEIFWGRKKR